MRCPKCGNENQDGLSFCQYCGTRLTAAPGGFDQGPGMQAPGQDFPGGMPSGGFSGNPGDSYGQGQNAPVNPGWGQNAESSSFFSGPSDPSPFPGGDSFSSPGSFSDFGNPPGSDPSQSWNPDPTYETGKPQKKKGGKGLPAPLIAVICILAVLLVLIGAAFALDHFKIVKVPVIHGLLNGEDSTQTEPADSGGDSSEETEEAEEPEEPDGKDDSDVSPDGNNSPGTSTSPNSGTLSISPTDIEPPELSDYKKVSVTGIHAAPGVDGTDALNMVNDDDSVWKTSIEEMSAADGKKIRLTIEESDVRVIRIKAGNWGSAEKYNSDSRPTKISLTIEGHKYPISLNDKQAAHYIVLSRSVRLSEILIEIDSYSNDTTGNLAVTNITVYSEK